MRLQNEHWAPLLKWLKEKYGITLKEAEGFGVAHQTPETVAKFRNILEGMDPFQLAAMERAVYATKSFVIALALVEGRITAHEAALASHVEVASQIERWGEVEDCELCLTDRRTDGQPTMWTTKTFAGHLARSLSRCTSCTRCIRLD